MDVDDVTLFEMYVIIKRNKVFLHKDVDDAVFDGHTSFCNGILFMVLDLESFLGWPEGHFKEKEENFVRYFRLFVVYVFHVSRET